MPLFFLIVGIVLIVTVINGTTFALARQLRADLTSGFITWFAAILVLGMLGFFDTLKEPTRYLLALMFLVVMLTNGQGFISMFIQQVQHPGQQPTPQPAGGNANLPPIPVQIQNQGGGSSGGSGSGGGGNNPLSAVSGIASILGPLL